MSSSSSFKKPPDRIIQPKKAKNLLVEAGLWVV